MRDWSVAREHELHINTLCQYPQAPTRHRPAQLVPYTHNSIGLLHWFRQSQCS